MEKANGLPPCSDPTPSKSSNASNLGEQLEQKTRENRQKIDESSTIIIKDLHHQLMIEELEHEQSGNKVEAFEAILESKADSPKQPLMEMNNGHADLEVDDVMQVDDEDKRAMENAAYILCSLKHEPLNLDEIWSEEEETSMEIRHPRPPLPQTAPEPTPHCAPTMQHPYVHSYKPRISSIDPALIEIYTEPILKIITKSDVQASQSRLLIPRRNVEEKLIPVLQDYENLERGIPVKVYDAEGRKKKMTFISWNYGKTHVLKNGWKDFCVDNPMEAGKDEVTIWMFRRRDKPEKLYFAVFPRRLSDKEVEALQPDEEKRKRKDRDKDKDNGRPARRPSFQSLA